MKERAVFLVRHLAPSLPVLALLLALEPAGFDAKVSGWFFDAASGTFPLRHDYLLEVIAHHWAKDLVIAIAFCVIALCALSALLPELRLWRRVLLFLSLAMTLAPLTVVTLKEASVRQCPWNLLEYGGFAPRLTLFDSVPAGLVPGHCFPASHATAGFCLMAFYFAGLALGRPRLARLALCGGMAAGLVLGLARVAQGAYYATGVLWAGLVCWIVIALLYVIMSPLQDVTVVAGGEAQEASTRVRHGASAASLLQGWNPHRHRG